MSRPKRARFGNKTKSKAIFVKGASGLNFALDHMSEVSARRIMKPAVSAGLTIAKQSAKNLSTSARVTKKIRKRVSKSKRNRVTGRIYVEDTEETRVSGGGHEWPLGQLIEFGHQPPNGKFVKARPFIRAAIPAKRSAINAKMVQVARAKMIEEAAKARAKGKSL